MEPTADLADMMQSVTTPSSVIVLGYVLALSLLPFIAVMASSYIKLVVVFHLLRNALGIQQIPPNLAVNGLAIILTVYIMAPALSTVFETLTTSDIDLNKPDLELVGETLTIASQPIVDFMLKHSDADEREFFLRATMDLWPDSYGAAISDRNIMILMPAFTMSELKAAFKIGFLLYMPCLLYTSPSPRDRG